MSCFLYACIAVFEGKLFYGLIIADINIARTVGGVIGGSVPALITAIIF